MTSTTALASKKDASLTHASMISMDSKARNYSSEIMFCEGVMPEHMSLQPDDQNLDPDAAISLPCDLPQ